jgi:hypothetical protein
MDFAVDALEIAQLVGVQVETHGKAAGSGRNHHVNETIIQEIARATKGCFLSRKTADRAARFPFLNVVSRLAGMLTYFLHNSLVTLTLVLLTHYTVFAKKWTFFA